ERVDELAFLTATEQAELVRRGEVASAELVELYLGRIERLDPELNAFVTVCADEARAAAAGELPDGPFGGVPLPIKDLNETAGSGRRIRRAPSPTTCPSSTAPSSAA